MESFFSFLKKSTFSTSFSLLVQAELVHFLCSAKENEPKERPLQKKKAGRACRKLTKNKPARWVYGYRSCLYSLLLKTDIFPAHCFLVAFPLRRSFSSAFFFTQRGTQSVPKVDHVSARSVSALASRSPRCGFCSWGMGLFLSGSLYAFIPLSDKGRLLRVRP